MTNYIYYHNPKCSKSRQGLALLEERNLKFQVKLYLTEKITQKEIEGVLKALSIAPLDGAIRVKEETFKELSLKGKELTLKEWAKLIVENPILLERPILYNGKKALIGRPPENLLSLIS